MLVACDAFYMVFPSKHVHWTRLWLGSKHVLRYPIASDTNPNRHLEYALSSPALASQIEWCAGGVYERDPQADQIWKGFSSARD